MRTYLLLLAGTCILCSTAQAQEPDTLSRTVFKLSPQHFIQNSLKAGVERFNKNHSASFAIFITGMIDNEVWSYSEGGYDGIGGELQLRKYISPMKPFTSKRGKINQQGIYGALYAQGGYYTGAFRGQTYTYEPMNSSPTLVTYDYGHRLLNGGLGFTIGYQKTLWQVVFMEAFLGGGIQFARHDISGTDAEAYLIDDGITAPGYQGIIPKIGLMIGIGL